MNPKLDNIIIDLSNDKFKEECGVFGIYSNKSLDLASVIYYGLYALQHRGQESAGIAVANGEDINIKKGMGLITEAFSQEDINSLKGFAGIGHVRYSTIAMSGAKGTPISHMQNVNNIVSKQAIA